MEKSSESELTRLANYGPLGYKLNDARLLQTLRSTVWGYWPNRKNNHFPAPLPVSLERKSFFKLKQYPYLICVKSDGMRFLMMCFNGQTYMVDRSFKFYKVNQNFTDAIYGSSKDSCGAMFDGELIKNKKGTWEYIVHDCIVMSGRDISQEHFDERYEAATTAVNEFWSKENSDFGMCTKRFYTFDEVDELRESLKSGGINHNTDGLIFTPKTLGIGTSTQYTLFKWKPREHHTFDFKVVDDGNVYNAFVTQGQNDLLFGSVVKKTPEGKVFSELLEKNCPGFKNNDIVECDYNKKTKSFDPVMIRTDKSHPNSLFTVEKTMCNIKENITMEELLTLRK